MANGPKKGKPEAERRAHQGVDVVRGCDALLHQLRGFVEQRVLQAVQHEAGDVLDDGGLLAGGVDQLARRAPTVAAEVPA